VDGLENLVRDLEKGEGELVVRLADETAFRVGENIATTPGEVVFRNRIFELIQYTPTTAEVHEIPLLIFPALDQQVLHPRPQGAEQPRSSGSWTRASRSLSCPWVNPDRSYNETSLTHYVGGGLPDRDRRGEGDLRDRDHERRRLLHRGTTLALTLALMKRRGRRRSTRPPSSPRSPTSRTRARWASSSTNDFVDGIEQVSMQKGILESFYMARTFSWLRSNDLIYQPAIRNYMLGETPPAFDLLYWNSDGTNLPGHHGGRVSRGLCQDDRFATTGFPICGETVHISEVTVPICGVACETDHIAAGSRLSRHPEDGLDGQTFILSESAHRGIVNPPQEEVRPLVTRTCLSPEDWLRRAEKHKEAGGRRWGEWLASASGP
jgi:polyhydroxyalkanoate synthase